ncbi:MAG: DUF4185 domain-containing protein [Agriterribacter sp.]
MLRLLFISLSVFFSAVFSCCFAQTKQIEKSSGNLHFSVAPAPEWNDLFTKNHGWFGGDGMFCTRWNGNEQQGNLSKDSVLIWFSDTMIGDIINDSLQDGFLMINNSIAVLKKQHKKMPALQFYWPAAEKQKAPLSVFVPNTVATKKGEYYWLGDGFVNTALKNDIFIFGYRIKNIPDQAQFGFKQTGTALIRIPVGEKIPFIHQSQKDLPFFQGENIDSAGSFGSALLINTKQAGAPDADEYLYIYGVRGQNKEVIVARVKPGLIESFDQWTFWTGKEWSSNLKDIQPIADHASNELSVTSVGHNRYLMIFQKDAISTTIAMRVGQSPVGPFGPIIEIYDTRPNIPSSPDIFPYNAKAHAVLSEPGELLISYHINSFDFKNDIKKYPHLYSPRFIKLKYTFQ